MRPLVLVSLLLFALAVTACGHERPRLILADGGETDTAGGSDARDEGSDDALPGDLPGDALPDTGPGGCRQDADCQDVPGLSACRRAFCLKASRVCLVEDVPAGGACEPDDPCVVDATCQQGECVGTPRTCDDDDPCTADACDPATGLCASTPLSAAAPCDDGAPCTTDDQCDAGFCVGSPVVCPDDGDPCTKVACSEETGGCVTSVAYGAPCSDDDACTTGDACDLEGSCIGKPTTCADGNPCTADTCDPMSSQCVFTLTPGAPCEDDNPCTADDTCSEQGVCVGEGLVCDDGNPCTTDACAPDGSETCVFSPRTGTPCDDGDPCTTNDLCFAGMCAPGAPVTGCCSSDTDCPDEGDSCSTTRCVQGTCVTEPLVCPDPGPCGWARCVGGACVEDWLDITRIGLIFKEDFEGQPAPAVTVLGGQTDTTSASSGQRSVRMSGNGPLLRLSFDNLPSGATRLGAWIKTSACSGAGLVATIDGTESAIGCVPTNRWRHVSVPTSSGQAGPRVFELAWSGGGVLNLDLVQVVLSGRAGCYPPQGTLSFPVGAAAAGHDAYVDDDHGLRLVVASESTDLATQLTRFAPGAAEWSVEPITTDQPLAAPAAGFRLAATATPEAGGAIALGPLGTARTSALFLPETSSGQIAPIWLGGWGGRGRERPDLLRLSDHLLVAYSIESPPPAAGYIPVWITASFTDGSTGPLQGATSVRATTPNDVRAIRLDSGHLVFAWTQDGVILATVQEESGYVTTPVFQASPGDAIGASNPTLAPMPLGRFLLAWVETGSDGADVRAIVLDRYGQPLIAAIPIPKTSAGSQRRPAAVADDKGRFLVAWDTDPQGWGTPVPRYRVFDESGGAGDEIALDVGGLPGSGIDLVRLGPYHVFATWRSEDGVRGRLFGFGCPTGMLACQGSQTLVCTGDSYSLLPGSCTGPACEPDPCP